MSKVTNKLTNGIRKVKAEQAVPAASPKPVATAKSQSQPVIASQSQPVTPPARTDKTGFLHPTRVWPD